MVSGVRSLVTAQDGHSPRVSCVLHFKQTTKVGGKWKLGGLAKAVLKRLVLSADTIYLTSFQSSFKVCEEFLHTFVSGCSGLCLLTPCSALYAAVCLITVVLAWVCWSCSSWLCYCLLSTPTCSLLGHVLTGCAPVSSSLDSSFSSWSRSCWLCSCLLKPRI
jgi:hypothetical protein